LAAGVGRPRHVKKNLFLGELEMLRDKQKKLNLFILIIISTILIAPSVVFISSVTAQSCNSCISTGEPCYLGIDPDIYQMPLYGVSIQCGDEQICATVNWCSYPPDLFFPPEAFGIDFMRYFWTLMNEEQQTQTEAMAFYLLLTHWGPPWAPPADLSEMMIPSDFSGEVFSCLDSRTTRIEFEVPKSDFEKLGWNPTYLPPISPDPYPDVPCKLRGWYIKGDGISNEDDQGKSDAEGDDDDNIVHPLIILSAGFPYSIAYDLFVGGIDVGRQMRKTATYLVARGFDVLMFDKRGFGYSEGILDGMGEDVFRALDQLELGEIFEEGIPLTLTIITPDGRRLVGAAAAAENLLGEAYTAQTKPIVLRGFSYGSSQLQKAMAMNYSNLPVEYRFTRDVVGNVVVDWQRMPSGNRGYNFKGIIAISGFTGSIKYETVPYFLALDALGSTVGHNGAILKSSVYLSMDNWPAFLGLYSTNDFETADGAIDVFNERLRGFKDIKMVTGYHFGLASEEVDTYFAYESAEFAEHAIFCTPPMNNYETTTYAEEVCDSERVIMDPDTQSIVEVLSQEIRKANREVDRFIDKWIDKQ
jgi:pimeloyl-ACP methyl ester carboxylesterase